MSEPTVVHVPEENAYAISLDGEEVGYTYYAEEAGQRIFFHTEVDDEYEGQGLASKLVLAAGNDTREAGLRIVPVCPYWKKWVEEHDDFADVVDPVTADSIDAVRRAQAG